MRLSKLFSGKHGLKRNIGFTYKLPSWCKFRQTKCKLFTFSTDRFWNTRSQIFSGNSDQQILGSCTVRNNFRCGIGKARSGKIPIPHRFFPIPHRKYRCGIGKNRCAIGISDVLSVFPMWYRNFSATCLFRYHIGNYF